MPRGRSRYATPGPRAGSVLLDTRGACAGAAAGGAATAAGGGFRWGRLFRWMLVLAILGGIGYGVYLWRAREDAVQARHDAAQRFVAAWTKGDEKAMWRELTPQAQRSTPERRFVTAYANADRAAGVEAVRAGRLGEERDGRIAVPVRVRTDIFKTLTGTMQVPVSGTGDEAGVDWNFSLRLPGLGRDEAVVRRAGREPRRAMIIAADGSALDATPIGASIAGRSGDNPTGLERQYDDRLGGHPSARLLFGDRVIARTKAVGGRPVRTTLEPRLMAAANDALGGKLGGVAVIRPRDGAVQALAGLAVSAPQPPGSTFKIITTAAALDHKVATPDTSYPGADRRHAVGRQPAQRGRRGVRRLALRGVRRVLQLGVRAARRQGRLAPAGQGRRGVRLQREAAHPGGAAEHDVQEPQGRPGRRGCGDRPGPRPGDAAGDGERRRDDRQ